jgi:tagaturonate reductase
MAILAGFETVIEAMRDPSFKQCIQSLIHEELAPCVVNEVISKDEATEFSNKVLERFSNPYIEHKWISISLNFEEKMKMRNSYLMETYAQNHTEPAKYMSMGFAAFCIYMEQAHQKAILVEDYFKDSTFAAAVHHWVQAIKENGMQNTLTV